MFSYSDFFKIKEQNRFDHDLFDIGIQYNPETKKYCSIMEDITFQREHIKDGKLIYPLDDEIYANIDASDLNLTSLEGFPAKQCKELNIAHNKITSLKGCPEEILAEFDCSDNGLTSLEGGPRWIHSNFICSNTLITDLKGFPEVIENKEYWSDITLRHNAKLTSLEGLQDAINIRNVDLTGCTSLESLKFLPKRIERLYLTNTKVRNLKDLKGKFIDHITTNDHISLFEYDFYFLYVQYEDKDFNYDQELVKYLLERKDAILKQKEDFNKIEIDFDNIKLNDEDLNFFKSLKGITKYNLY